MKPEDIIIAPVITEKVMMNYKQENIHLELIKSY